MHNLNTKYLNPLFLICRILVLLTTLNVVATMILSAMNSASDLQLRGNFARIAPMWQKNSTLHRHVQATRWETAQHSNMSFVNRQRTSHTNQSERNKACHLGMRCTGVIKRAFNFNPFITGNSSCCRRNKANSGNFCSKSLVEFNMHKYKHVWQAFRIYNYA